MKRLEIYLLLGLSLAGFGALRVNALTFKNSDNNGKIETCDEYEVTQNGDGENYTIKLKEDAALDFVFEDGETVTFDLNGFTLTNYCATCSPIYVKEGATVTIKSSKGNEDKIGTITYKEGSSASGDYYASLIRNEVTLEEGIIDVNKGAETTNTKPYAIGIDNLKTLTISGGEVKTSHNNAWGVNNQKGATADINGGTFTQGADFSVVMNHGEMSITDGNFGVSEENTGAHSLISSIGEEENPATLNISGGSFVGNNDIFYEPTEGETYGGVSITGGSYALTGEDAELDLSNYIDDKYQIDESGKVTVIPTEEPTEKPAEKPAEKSPDTGDINLLFILSMIVLATIGTIFAKKKIAAKAN